MTKQSATFRAHVEALVAALPSEFEGRIVINVAGNGGVKVELSEFFRARRGRYTDRDRVKR